MNPAIPIALLLGFFTVAVAQQSSSQPQASPRPELPPGPLLSRAPEMAEWTITFKAQAGAANTKTAQRGQTRTYSEDYRAVVTKTRSIYHVTMVTGAGVRSDRWSVNNVQVMFLSNARLPVVATSSEMEEFYMDFGKSDFPDLGWISRKNFVDVKPLGGVAKGLVFEDQLKNPNPDGFPLKVRAVIDLQTRLPLLFQIDNGIGTFQFGAPPQAMLVPPANVVSLADQLRKQVQQASLMPPP